jgi:hypothetical protein
MKRRDFVKVAAIAPLGLVPLTQPNKYFKNPNVGPIGRPYCGPVPVPPERSSLLYNCLYGNDKPEPPLRENSYAKEFNTYTKKFGPQMKEWHWVSGEFWRDVKKDSKDKPVYEPQEYKNDKGELCLIMKPVLLQPIGWKITWQRKGNLYIAESDAMLYLDADSFMPMKGYGRCELSQKRFDYFTVKGRPSHRIEAPLAFCSHEYTIDVELEYHKQGGRIRC